MLLLISVVPPHQTSVIDQHNTIGSVCMALRLGFRAQINYKNTLNVFTLEEVRRQDLKSL